MVWDNSLEATLSTIQEIDFETDRIGEVYAEIEVVQETSRYLGEDLALKRLRLVEDAKRAGAYLLQTFAADGARQGKELVLMHDLKRYCQLLDLGENGGIFDRGNFVLYQWPDGHVDMEPVVRRYIGSRRPITSSLTLGNVVLFFTIVDEHIRNVSVTAGR